MRKLYVKKININQLQAKWNTTLPAKWRYSKVVYIQCTAKGSINWEKNSVYDHSELLGRGNYVVL